jgi:hypothetical protein
MLKRRTVNFKKRGLVHMIIEQCFHSNYRKNFLIKEIMKPRYTIFWKLYFDSVVLGKKIES